MKLKVFISLFNTLLLLAILVLIILLLTQKNKKEHFDQLERNQFLDDQMEGAARFARMV